ncbi:MAG: hypothetical protein ACJ76G_09435 [Solirubrobacterales bacterium]
MRELVHEHPGLGVARQVPGDHDELVVVVAPPVGRTAVLALVDAVAQFAGERVQRAEQASGCCRQ